MMKTIKVKVPDGFTADWNDEKTVLTIVAPAKNPRESIKRWDDVLKYHKKNAAQFDAWCTGLLPHEVATRQIEMIAAAYNQGGKVDYMDGSLKYYPVFDCSCGGFRFNAAVTWNANSCVGSRLLFVGPEAKENAIDAVEKFPEIYKIHLLS